MLEIWNLKEKALQLMKEEHSKERENLFNFMHTTSNINILLNHYFVFHIKIE